MPSETHRHLTLGHTFGVAVLTAGADLGAPGDGVPRFPLQAVLVFNPFNCRHLTLFLKALYLSPTHTSPGRLHLVGVSLPIPDISRQ